MSEVLEERKIRKNGRRSSYVNVPKKFSEKMAEAMNLPIDDVLRNTKLVFEIKNGRPSVKVQYPGRS